MNGVWRPHDVSAGSETKSLLFETGIERELDVETRFGCWRAYARQLSFEPVSFKNPVLAAAV
jgi:hypothetical protein